MNRYLLLKAYFHIELVKQKSKLTEDEVINILNIFDKSYNIFILNEKDGKHEFKRFK